ncbi:MAG TPA: SUF system NifU family Fe-S cluster assembly protein [Candidatus Angelobacter sp.]|nr:SUF system NifU family Fe-S cluster assembly protein [Candidatus Angelobacter sp.]
MSELRELYQEVILEHSKKPRNYRALEQANHKAEGFNPLCGDHFTVYLDLKDGAINDIGFQGSGCAISKASASMMTQTLKGKTTAEAEDIFTKFHDLVTGQKAGTQEELGKLAVFAGVSEFPLRVKCATLAWHALRAAMRGEEQAVSTE